MGSLDFPLLWKPEMGATVASGRGYRVWKGEIEHGKVVMLESHSWHIGRHCDKPQDEC